MLNDSVPFSADRVHVEGSTVWPKLSEWDVPACRLSPTGDDPVTEPTLDCFSPPGRYQNQLPKEKTWALFRW